jgi:hypothetical protein
MLEADFSFALAAQQNLSDVKLIVKMKCKPDCVQNYQTPKPRA